MNLSMLLEMAADGFGSRIAYGSRDDGLTYEHLLDRSRRAASAFAGSGAQHVALVGENSVAVPLCLFGAGIAGLPYAPLNYRLADGALRNLVHQIEPAVLVADPDVVARVQGTGAKIETRDELVGASETAELTELPFVDPDAVAILLF